MSDKPSSMWRDALNVVVEAVSAERFHDELAWLREEYGNSPNLIGWVYNNMLADRFVTNTGLLAALYLPPEEIPAALAEIRETLTHLNFKQEQKRLKRNERRYYNSFAQQAATLFAELGQAMEALFNCYVAGDYDPDANADDLIAEALEIADEDLEHAHHLIAQAGAIALHGRPLWWRWQTEAYGPTEARLIATIDLVEEYTGGGMAGIGPFEQARADAETLLLQRTKTQIEQATEMKEEEESEQPAYEPSPVDDLIEELIELGKTESTPEQLALFQTHREEAIPALIDLACDEYLQTEDSPGDGYAPISAVRLLGALKAVEAIPALIDLVADVAPEAIIYNTAIHALKEIGPPAIEPILTFMRYSYDVEAKVGLAEIIETSGPDERIYQTLVTVWEEAAWEEGKCLLAYPLALSGGEQAIPLLEAALEDPDLDDLLDYNEVANALQELGVEPPPPSVDLGEFDFSVIGTIEGPFQDILGEISDPERLMDFTGAAPDEWHAHPEALAHAYTSIELSRLSHMFAMQAILFPPELSMPFTAGLLAAVDTLTFDAPTRDYPRWLRETYDHLAECAGPELQNQLVGVLSSLHHYLSTDYDIADEPDQLLASACKLSYESSEEEAEELRRLFGQAGALTLHGRSFWPRWPAEVDPPLSDWLEGLTNFRRLLENVGQIPLRLSSVTDPEELSIALMEALMEEEKQAPPVVAKLLDLLIARQQDTLPPAQRRRFAQQRAAVIPYLIHMVEDKQYWYEEGPGGGWAAILATRMLGELKAAQAADALVSAVADSTPEDVIHEAALFSLMAIGRPALPAVRAYFHYGRDIETKTSLSEVLGRIARRNTDAFDLLRQVWETAGWAQNRRLVALGFGDLRDRRAVPLLQAALNDRQADALDLEYVRWALQRLGTPLPPPKKMSSRLKTPAPYSPRLIYDEHDIPQRLRHTAWGEPLCPDCGKPLIQDKNGAWIHPPERSTRRSASGKTKRKRKRKRKKRRR